MNEFFRTPHAGIRISEMWPAPSAGLAALALYVRTLAPGLTWSHNGADGGDLLSAALTHGVAHPPGYPVYLLLLRATTSLPGAGQNPALAGNWLSAICAAAAAGLLADLVRRSLPDVPGRRAIAWLAALTWAASPALWSQAVITEVYALHALMVVAFLWLLYRFVADAAPFWPWLSGAALVMGLGLGNHLSMALLGPGAAAWLWSGHQRVAALPRRAWAFTAAALLLGLAVYLYLPWAAAGDPPVNWGDPRSLDRLLWLVTGQAYRGLVFGLPLKWLPVRLAALATEAVRQFWPWGTALAAVGLWRLDRTCHAWWRATLLVVAAFSLYAAGYDTADSYVYLIPAWAVVALWLGWGLAFVSGLLFDRAIGAGQQRRVQPFLPTAALLGALAVLPILSATVHWQAMDLSHDHEATDFVTGALAAAKPGGIILMTSDRPTFALWYALYGLGERSDLTPVNVSLYAYDWYRRSLTSSHPFVAQLVAEPDMSDWRALVRRLGEHRPIYRAESLPDRLTGFHEQPNGPLVALSPG